MKPTFLPPLARFGFALAAACGLTVSSVQAQNAIGINFNGGGGAVTAPTGVLTIATANWNNEANNGGTSVPLINNAGGASTALLTYSATGTYFSSTTSLGNLLNGYLDTQGGTATLSLTNIPYSTYNVYVYLGSDQNNSRYGTGTLTSSGGANSTLSYRIDDKDTNFNGIDYTNNFVVNSDPANSNPVVNTLLFTNVSGASLSYTSAQTFGGQFQGVGIAGIEIVNAVPEPGSLAACFLACGGLAFHQRRRLQALASCRGR